MARTNTNKEGLTDIPQEEEEKPTVTAKKKSTVNTSSNLELAFQSREEAEQGLREALQLLEKFHNWVAIENLKRDPSKQVKVMGIDITYLPKPMIRDGKVVTNPDGSVQYEPPAASLQLKLPVVPEAVSLPLNQAVYLPD